MESVGLERETDKSTCKTDVKLEGLIKKLETARKQEDEDNDSRVQDKRSHAQGVARAVYHLASTTLAI